MTTDAGTQTAETAAPSGASESQTTPDAQSTDTSRSNEGETRQRERRFSQDEVNSMIAAEKRRLQDSEEIKQGKAALRRLAELEAAQLSETERLTKERDEAAAKAETATTKARTALIKAAFLTAAPGKGIPADRMNAAMRLADFAAVQITDDDEVQGLEAVLDAVIQAHPFLIEKAKTAVPDINAGGGTTTTDPAAREAEIRSRFRLNR